MTTDREFANWPIECRIAHQQAEQASAHAHQLAALANQHPSVRCLWEQAIVQRTIAATKWSIAGRLMEDTPPQELTAEADACYDQERDEQSLAGELAKALLDRWPTA